MFANILEVIKVIYVSCPTLNFLNFFRMIQILHCKRNLHFLFVSVPFPISFRNYPPDKEASLFRGKSCGGPEKPSAAPALANSTY